MTDLSGLFTVNHSLVNIFKVPFVSDCTIIKTKSSDHYVTFGESRSRVIARKEGGMVKGPF